MDCVNLETIELPEGLTSIGYYSFRKCEKLSLTELPESVTVLDEFAFALCSNVALTKLPSNLTVIEECALSGTNLISIEIPESVTKIGNMAFSSCPNLNTVTFKGTPQDMRYDIFNKCSNLTTINVPWAEGEVYVSWGTTSATINYNYTGE